MRATMNVIIIKKTRENYKLRHFFPFKNYIKLLLQ